LTGKLTRLALVEDHVLVRSGLRLLLEAEHDFAVAWEVSTAAEASAALTVSPVDVALVDLGLPGASGLECMASLRALDPTIKMIAVTMLSGEEVARQVAAVGGYALINKAQAAVTLVRTIRDAMSGQPPPLAAAAPRTPGVERRASLTERERQVLAAIAGGLTNGEIADRLDISVKTVEAHRARVGEKTGLRTRAQLVRWALENLSLS
jgi:DNA-binding NarL/FixJ family response regulator